MTRGKIHPVILSGGSGSRLWPLSRARHPKQFLGLTGDDSPLDQTLLRVADPARFAPPLVICNEEHRFLVGEALQKAGLAAEAIVVEPVARNTAPAACVAALKLAARDPGSLMVLLPADHHIADEGAFASALSRAAEAAAAGWLVTFGVKPTRPETGYGYICCAEPLEGLAGCHQVARFVEKPDRATAEQYLSSGDYVWNSGMFVLAVGPFLDEMSALCPDVVDACRAALGHSKQDADFLRLGADAFAGAPSVSIDYAVFEKTKRAAVVPADMGWTDLGSWDALWQVCETDGAGNAMIGDVVACDTRDSYLRSDGRLLAAVGVSDVVVVALRDAVVVCPRDRAQDIRQIVEKLEASGREEIQSHRRVSRPWGSYETIDSGPGFRTRHLVIKPGASISLQGHQHRAGHWIVVRGKAEVTRDDQVFVLEANQSVIVPKGAIHRLSNPGDQELHIVEVQSGDKLGTDDVERLADIDRQN